VLLQVSIGALQAVLDVEQVLNDELGQAEYLKRKNKSQCAACNMIAKSPAISSVQEKLRMMKGTCRSPPSQESY